MATGLRPELHAPESESCRSQPRMLHVPVHMSGAKCNLHEFAFYSAISRSVMVHTFKHVSIYRLVDMSCARLAGTAGTQWLTRRGWQGCASQLFESVHVCAVALQGLQGLQQSLGLELSADWITLGCSTAVSCGVIHSGRSASTSFPQSVPTKQSASAGLIKRNAW